MAVAPYLLLGLVALLAVLFLVSLALRLNKTRYWPGVVTWIISFSVLLILCILQWEDYRTRDPWNYGGGISQPRLVFPGIGPEHWFLNALLLSLLAGAVVNFIVNKIRGR